MREEPTLPPPAEDDGEAAAAVVDGRPTREAVPAEGPLCCAGLAGVDVWGSAPEKRYSPQGSNTKRESWLSTCVTISRHFLGKIGVELFVSRGSVAFPLA